MTDLPTGWEWATVEEVGDVQLGRQRSPKVHAGTNMCTYLRVANVFEDRIDTSDLMSMHFEPDEFERYRLHAGEILLNEGQSPEFLGRPAMYRGDPPGVAFTNSLIRFRAYEGIDPEWALLVFRRHMHLGRFAREARITTNIAHLSATRFKSIEFPVPPLAEQRRIVAAVDEFLSKISLGSRNLHTLLATMRTLRKTVLTAACTGRLGASAHYSLNSTLPNIGTNDGLIPAIPETWKWTRLGIIADVVGGVTKDAKKQSDPALSEVPYLRVANVQRGRLDLRRVTTIRVPAEKARTLALQPGDVLLNEGGDRDKLGRGWIWEGQIGGCIHQNHVFRARIRDNVLHPKLLAWHANEFGQGWCERNGKQSVNLASISLSKIKLLPVPIPPPEEQDSLVTLVEEYLTVLDAGDRLVRNGLIKADNLRRSLLAEAFAGRLVAQDPGDEPASVLLERIRAQRAAAGNVPQGRRWSVATAATSATNESQGVLL